MVGIGWGRDEVEALIERLGVVILRVGGEGSESGDVGGLQSTKHGVLKQASSETFSLVGDGNCQSRKQHDRNWMTGQSLCEAFGRITVGDFAIHQRVEPDNFFPGQGNVGVGRAGLLILKSVPDQEAIKIGLATIK